MDSKSNAAIRTDPVAAEPSHQASSGPSTARGSIPVLPMAQQAGNQSRLPARVWMKTTGTRYLVRTLALVAAVVLWQLASTNGFHFYINFDNIPAPSVVGAVVGGPQK